MGEINLYYNNHYIGTFWDVIPKNECDKNGFNQIHYHATKLYGTHWNEIEINGERYKVLDN